MSRNFSPDLFTSNPKDVTSLDDDLASSRLLKYNKLAAIVKQWIFKILQEEEPSGDLMDVLQTGTVLCRLVNKIELDYNNGTNKVKFKDSSIAFMQMENISFFLNYCKLVGVPHDELFQTVDLFEKKDPYQVALTMQSLSRSLNKKFPNIEIIGPKIFDKPPVPRKPKKLQAVNYTGKNPNWSTIEYGYIDLTTENSLFGGTRRI